MKALSLLLITMLSGCTQFIEHNSRAAFPIKSEVLIEVRQLKGGDQSTLAYAELYKDKCIIYLRKYPQCLAHEVRHCYEGNWHEGRKTSEDC